MNMWIFRFSSNFVSTSSLSADPSEVGETPDTEEVEGKGEEEKCTEELAEETETVAEGDQAVPEEIVPPTNVIETEESFMETEWLYDVPSFSLWQL